jgi:hypothetical protein
MDERIPEPERHMERVLERLRSPVGVVHGTDGRCRREVCQRLLAERGWVGECRAYGHWRDTLCSMVTVRWEPWLPGIVEPPPGAWLHTTDPIACPECLWVLKQEPRAAELTV